MHWRSPNAYQCGKLLFLVQVVRVFYVIGFLATFSFTIYKLKGSDQELVKKSKSENNSHSKKSMFLIMTLNPVSKYELKINSSCLNNWKWNLSQEHSLRTKVSVIQCCKTEANLWYFQYLQRIKKRKIYFPRKYF